MIKKVKSGAQMLMDKYQALGAKVTHKSNGKNIINGLRQHTSKGEKK